MLAATCRTPVSCSKSLIPLLLLVIFALSQPVFSAEPFEYHIIHEGSFQIENLRWTVTANGAVFPRLKGTRQLSQPGLPDLLVQNFLFLVPADRPVASVQIEVLESHREISPGNLAKAGPIVASTGDEIFDTSMSDFGESFPESWSLLGGNHTWRGYRLVSVSVFPLRRVDTDNGTALEFLDQFAVTVAYADESAEDGEILQRERWIPGEMRDNLNILQDLVDNPEMAQGYKRTNGQAVGKSTSGFAPNKTPSLNGSAVSYLIITNEELASAFQILADHKNAQGIATVVATREYIAANFRNGADIQETIRMFIQDAYAKWGLEYVLLGGDSDVLPPRYVDNSFYPLVGSTLVPVDLYFACLDGTWNSNKNALYGEPASGPNGTDDVDFAEEVYVGRAAVSTPAQAAVFVNKVITYESTPAGSAWPNRALFAAEVLFPDDYHIQQYIILDGARFSHQQITSHIIPCTDMEYFRMYETDDENPWDMPLTRTALIDTLNNSRYGIVNQIGHGYIFNMSVANANFMTTDADNLTNGDHLFMLYALNCASAAFDNSCLLERFVQNPNGGSVCSLGSVRAAFPNNANGYQQEFFSKLYCTGETRVGKLMAMSRLPFVGLTTANQVDRWTFENYTLLGDPTLPIWTGVPQALQVAGPISLDLGDPSVTFTVTSSGGPMPGASVCLNMGTAAVAVGVTDELGQVTLDFLPVETGDATLTITGKNLELYAKTIPVNSGAAFLGISDMAITDNGTLNSLGNNNQEIEAGEIVVLMATLNETGGVGASGLTAILSTTDTRVFIEDDSDSFPNVGAGGSTTGAGGFRVNMAESIVDGSAISFGLEVTNGEAQYLSEWTVVVKAPECEPVELTWNDQGGNGNGIVENGELLTLNLALKNYGAGNADFVTGFLRTDNGNVVLTDTVATWSDLGPLSESAGSVDFTMMIVDASREYSCRIDLIDNYDRSFSVPIQVGRPDAPTDIISDSSLGVNTIQLIWNPPANAGILGYNIYRSETLGGDFAKVNPDLIRGTSSYRDESLNQLTLYYYKVSAVDESFVEGTLSSVVQRSTAPPELGGFPVSFAGETSGPLAVGDVDGDGDLEVVLASNQVYVWHHDGLELMDGDQDSQTLGPITNYNTGTLVTPAAVALFELDGIPGQEMIVSENAPEFLIHIYTKDGSELSGWPQSTDGVPGTKWNWAAPAVGDIDGDGVPEIVVATLNGIIWAWHRDGTEVRDGDVDPSTNGVFFVRPGAESEWSRSGPALYDLDHDGAKDIIFGTRNDSTGLRRLMAIRYDGTDVVGFPYLANGAIVCTPAVGDLDNDGQVEIVFWDAADYVYAVQEDGSDYPGFPVNPGYNATAGWVSCTGLGDMDGDGELEIVYTPNRTGLESRIYVFDTDHAGGTSGQILPGFPVTLAGSSESSPIIGDIDGDTIPDIVHGIGGGNENAPYHLYAYRFDGSAVAGFPITLTGPLMPPVVITDLDSDLDVDIVYGGWDSRMHVWDMPFAYDRHNVPWPTYQGNMKRDGVLFPLAMIPVVDDGQLPSNRLLVQAPYPNPFNPSTRIRMYVPAGGDLELGIYDLQGHRIHTLHRGPITRGWHTLIWDGKNSNGHMQASGVYFVRALRGAQSTIKKITLVK